MDIYEELKKAGCELSHHESDLYIKIDFASRCIIQSYEFKKNIMYFIYDGDTWADIPFAYTPFWDKKLKGRI